MKTLSLSLILSMSVSVSAHSFAVQPNEPDSATQIKKRQPQIQLLDKAWSLRTSSVPKKLAFVEQLLKESEAKGVSPEHLSRLKVAIALIALSEKDTELAAADLISEAAKIAPLKLNKTAVRFIWKEFLTKINATSQLGTMALTDVATALESAQQGEVDPAHTYFFALSKINQTHSQQAISEFTKIDPTSQFYRQAKLQEGLLLASEGKNDTATAALELVIALDHTDAEKKSNVSPKSIIRIKERAIINLARIYFENKKYNDAVALYRSIDTQSPLFYESLTEQGWAFFLAGHPNRALGVGYGATSPHFNQQFQPDQYFLKAAVNYWLCDFKAAKGDLESFARHAREDAKFFRGWGTANASANTKNKGDDKPAVQNKAFSVIEGLFLGVQAKNNLLGPKSLQTLGRNQALMSGLNELSQLRSQRKSIAHKLWPIPSKKLITLSLLNREEKAKQHFSEVALTIVHKLKNEYEKSLEQMRIIHLEIMTAEKDKLMKSGRTVEGQQFTETENDFLDQFQGETSHVWADTKSEFWKDELDSFVFNKKSKCEQQEGEEENNET